MTETVTLTRLQVDAKPEAKPVAHLVWRQYLRAADDVEDYYEVARPGDKCVDGSEPFPVYAHPPKPEATEGGAHEKGIEAALSAKLVRFDIPYSEAVEREDVEALLSAYLKASGLVLCDAKPVAWMLNGNATANEHAVNFAKDVCGAAYQPLYRAPSPALGNEKEGGK